MKIAKILLGTMLVLFAVIIGFISIVGLGIYLVVMGYTVGFFYLANRSKYFSEFYRELSRSYGENNAIAHIFSPLILGAYLYGILTLPGDDSKYSRRDIFLLSVVAIVVYFLIIFLPSIIRAKRKLR
jgi:hypothetical protein